MSPRPRQVFSLLALMLAAVVVVQQMTAHANGRVVDFTRKTAGPYEIALGTIPSDPIVGNLHLTMTVGNLSASTFIFDADITVAGTGPGSDVVEVGPLVGQNNPTDPAFYDINTSVNRVGTWKFTISVSAEQGDASTDFPIDVREASPVAGIITLMALIVFVAILGFSVRAYLRERGKSAGRQKS